VQGPAVEQLPILSFLIMFRFRMLIDDTQRAFLVSWGTRGSIFWLSGQAGGPIVAETLDKYERAWLAQSANG
jgi:hypothetical protein